MKIVLTKRPYSWSACVKALDGGGAPPSARHPFFTSHVIMT